MGNTSIAWTNKTWNPVVGCSRVSAGCKNCYAFELHDKRHKGWQNGWKEAPTQYHQPFSEIQTLSDRLRDPLRWRSSQRVFVNSMSDLFHPDVPERFIDQVWGIMMVGAMRENAPHVFQVLTKRPERMREYLTHPERQLRVSSAVSPFVNDADFWCDAIRFNPSGLTHPNIWLGTSVEDQKSADKRIPLLLDVPAAVRFLSCEPLLEEVDLRLGESHGVPTESEPLRERADLLHWVICGGESGPGARPMELYWAVRLREACQQVGIPFFMKQFGSFLAQRYGFVDKKGENPLEWIEELRVQEYPG
jgi:protein gp37